LIIITTGSQFFLAIPLDFISALLQFSEMRYTIFAFAALLLLGMVSAKDSGIIKLKKVDKIEHNPMKKGQKMAFCVEGTGHLTGSSWFTGTVFNVKSKDSKGKSLPMSAFAVKTISSDDLITHFWNQLQKFTAGRQPPAITDEPDLAQLNNNVFRDLSSACPSILSKGTSECTITTSEYGTSCIVVTGEQDYQRIDVSVDNTFQMHLIAYLLVGFLILVLARSLSENVGFQYLTGAFSFSIFGAAILLWFVVNRLTPRNGFLSSLFWGITIFASYSASVFWFILDKLQVLIISYKEYVLGYILVTAVVGAMLVWFNRRNDGGKEFLTGSVKLFLDVVGLVFLYNSAAS
jgi:hypothetical protein